MRGQVWSKVWS